MFSTDRVLGEFSLNHLVALSALVFRLPCCCTCILYNANILYIILFLSCALGPDTRAESVSGEPPCVRRHKVLPIVSELVVSVCRAAWYVMYPQAVSEMFQIRHPFNSSRLTVLLHLLASASVLGMMSVNGDSGQAADLGPCIAHIP